MTTAKLSAIAAAILATTVVAPLAAQDRGWSKVRIDVVGVRIGRGPTPEITHLRAVG